MLVFILLQNGKRPEYLFIVNHIIRSPKETKDILSCPCLYYVLLVLYLILNPAPDRNIFLSNVKTDASDSTLCKFALLDSDGEEEELFEVVRDWTSYDIISLLNQMSVANLYEHILFEKRLKVWKFLATLPYKCISKKMLWNILWIFHSSHIFEEDIYLEKDIDLKLNDDKMVSAFIEKLSTFEQSNQLYLLNAYKSIAFCGNIEKELLFFLVHEIFQVAFGKSALLHLSKEGTVVLKDIIKKYPDLLTVLLKEIRTSEDDSVNLSLYMFQEMDLREWIPKCEDVQSIKDWLLEMPLSSPKNFLARILEKLVLPKQLHIEVAVLVLQAYMKYDRKGNEWTVSSGLTQMVQFATMGRFLREEERFVPWAWDLLFTLKLHALDQKFPLWVQIYDGFSDVDFYPILLKKCGCNPF
ncbi:ectopic P granules protein 5 [Caerostris extrusa]|uniref:Ectopic P granules protein 5 n=1 Tax=Caerostris extrusa TaxID=172846 RepID=A0AAV4S194_CAEEX|nr:ectopic P granules protein 5 [Caerostris extrusa]